ncbi:MAG: hypothetical protein CSB47_07980 [Proteobacteria bacterium]|nr:MAG: hypothetical protein CSB47_07980 [Pseudomonadota bacterium]
MSVLQLKKILFIISLLGTLILTGAVYGQSPLPHSRTTGYASEAEDDKPLAGRNRRRHIRYFSPTLYPRANTDYLNVTAGTNKVRINVLANDTGRHLRVRTVNPRSARGGRVYMKNNKVIYIPLVHYVGKDSFWYSVIDRSGRKHSAKVIICICDS